MGAEMESTFARITRLEDENKTLRVRCDIAEAGMSRLRRQLCRALENDPVGREKARNECGLCAGGGDCAI